MSTCRCRTLFDIRKKIVSIPRFDSTTEAVADKNISLVVKLFLTELKLILKC